MSFDVNVWLKIFEDKVKLEFKDRLEFLGLQGSYNRNEATETSDIDLIVILDKLSFVDIKIYKSIVKSMPYNEKACGFIAGVEEISKWTKVDMFQFVYDTKPLFGSLKNIVNPPSLKDIKQAFKSGVEDLYHSTVHSFLYDKDPRQSLICILKNLFFILQAKYFIKDKKYFKTKNMLINKLEGIEKEMIKVSLRNISKEEYSDKDIEALYEKLIFWCQTQLKNL